MKILFVEDDGVKRNRVISLIQEALTAPDIVVEKSLQSGLRRLRSDTFDIILLDMTLPNYDPGPSEPGGKPQIFGGREFLRQMDRFEIETPVIVVTQFASFGKGTSLVTLQDLDNELRTEHGDVYQGAIYYNAAIQSWTEELRSLLRKVAEKI